MFCFFFKDFFLFVRERHKEGGRDIGRGGSRLPAGSLMQDSIPGSWEHALGQRQAPNRLATQASLATWIFKNCSIKMFCTFQSFWVSVEVAQLNLNSFPKPLGLLNSTHSPRSRWKKTIVELHLTVSTKVILLIPKIITASSSHLTILWSFLYLLLFCILSIFYCYFFPVFHLILLTGC